MRSLVLGEASKWFRATFHDVMKHCFIQTKACAVDSYLGDFLGVVCFQSANYLQSSSIVAGVLPHIMSVLAYFYLENVETWEPVV